MRLHASAHQLEGATRSAVLHVLTSLANDHTESPETRADVRTLLNAITNPHLTRNAA